MSAPVLTGEQVFDPMLGIRDVVPYPYCTNVRIGPGNELESHLSVMSEMSIRAAILVQAEHPEAKIVIPGESPFLREGLTNTTDHMADMALEAGVAEGALVRLYEVGRFGRGLDNTYLQSRAVGEHFEGRSDDGALVIPLRYHQARVTRALKAFGMTPDFVTVESVLHEAGIHEYDRYLPVIDGLQAGEERARKLTNGIHLPKGQLINFLMKVPVIGGGPRVVDVIEKPDGELVLEDTTARKKVVQLKRQIKRNADAALEAKAA